MKRREWSIPTWHADGLCARDGVDPHRWDGREKSVPPNLRGESMVDMALLCDGCPVAALCAREALEDRPSGCVRAGVPVPTAWTHTHAENSRRLNVLTAVAAGMPPAVACAVAYAEAPGYEDAAADLLDACNLVGVRQ